MADLASRRPLLIATSNKHKARELADLLTNLPWEVRTLADFPPLSEPVEDGLTFQANAEKKALYYARQHNVHVVADDSGLVVDALGGAPGVFSARYAGPGCTDADNNRKLLAELDAIQAAPRTARFVCCAAHADPEGHVHTELGTVEGHLAQACRGTGGFGYDPMFIPEGFDLTFGELPPEVKMRISHRARAFQKLRVHLESLS